MTACVYDNPDTYCREAYQDGRLIAHISARLLLDRNFRGDRYHFPFYLNIGPWREGQTVGNVAAIPEDQRPIGAVLPTPPEFCQSQIVG